MFSPVRRRVTFNNFVERLERAAFRLADTGAPIDGALAAMKTALTILYGSHAYDHFIDVADRFWESNKDAAIQAIMNAGVQAVHDRQYVTGRTLFIIARALARAVEYCPIHLAHYTSHATPKG